MLPREGAVARNSKIHPRPLGRRSPHLHLHHHLRHRYHHPHHPNRRRSIRKSPRPTPAGAEPRGWARAPRVTRALAARRVTMVVQLLRSVPPGRMFPEIQEQRDRTRATPETHWVFPAECGAFPRGTRPIPAPPRAGSSKWRTAAPTGSRPPSLVQDFEHARRFRPGSRDVVFHTKLEQVMSRIQRR
jgi:hypothetical protein